MASRQRKAWNEAMRSAAGASALPPGLQPKHAKKRRSDRRKKQDRRERARKTTSTYFSSSGENQEFLAAAWMDALEDVPASGGGADGAGGGGGDDDDSYDELEDLEAEISNKKTNKRSSRGSASSSKKNAQKIGVLPKRFKARSLANILMEEVNREDGAARDWINSEARVVKRRNHDENSRGDNSNQRRRILHQMEVLPPIRKFCPVTGMEGIYTEPKTGIPFANLKALEQIRERPPPWMTLGGTLAYHEVVKSIRDED